MAGVGEETGAGEVANAGETAGAGPAADTAADTAADAAAGAGWASARPEVISNVRTDTVAGFKSIFRISENPETRSLTARTA